jgi:hypothetical protein
MITLAYQEQSNSLPCSISLLNPPPLIHPDFHPTIPFHCSFLPFLAFRTIYTLPRLNLSPPLKQLPNSRRPDS